MGRWKKLYLLMATHEGALADGNLKKSSVLNWNAHAYTSRFK